jgi:hypothetical protein
MVTMSKSILKNSLFIITLLFSAHAILVAMPANLLERRPITPENMYAASRSLTKQESELLAAFIEQKSNEAHQERVFGVRKTVGERLQQIFNDFYQHRYDQVLQGLSALGYDPQDILHTSKLRIAMLSGSLEHTLWVLREIAGLDWFFERDAKRKRKDWPKPQDKLDYLMKLADELVMNHTKVFDPTQVLDAVDSLENHINMLSEKAPRIFKQRLDGTLEKLESLRNEYTKEPHG